MPELRPYYAKRGLSARYYDLITHHDASLAGDIALYAALTPPRGEVLELGAGTGRVAFALAELGFTVHQVLDYVVTGASGMVETRSFERQTFYAADPGPLAEPAGSRPARPPQRLGGVGDVHVFRKEW